MTTPTSSPSALPYVPAVPHGDGVCLKIATHYTTMSYAEYTNFRAQHRGTVLTVVDGAFPYGGDIVFETLLPAAFRLDNMWRQDLLGYWVWKRTQSGVSSVQERLDGLELAAMVLHKQ